MKAFVPCASMLICTALSGCGIDQLFVQASAPPAVEPRGPDGGGDAGLDGGGLYLPDGATRYLPDGALREGSHQDGSRPDGGPDWDGATVMLPDGAIIDGEGQVVVPLEGCTIDEDAVWRKEVPFGDEGGHALTTGGAGFGVAYRLDDGCDSVDASAVASSGAFPLPTPVLGSGACTVVRDLALLREDDSWLLAWVDNRSGSAELHRRYLAADMGSPGEPMRVTENNEGENKPALTRIGDRTLLAWLQGNASQRSIQVADVGGEPIEIVAKDGPHLPLKLAITGVGGDQAGALAWVNEQGDRGIWLQPLAADGAPVGAPIELTDLASAGSTVDLAKRTRGSESSIGGAAVYSVIVEGVNREVRFRRLDSRGQPIEGERVLVGRPYRAQDASIDQAGDGYVVAYRSLPVDPAVGEPEIRVMFVTREGAVTRDAIGRALTYKVASATATASRTTVRVSTEGQLLISWLDFDPRTGENILKMTRRRLDCR